MKSRNGDKHDGTHKGGKDVFDNDDEEVGCRGAAGWEKHDDQLRKHGGDESSNKGPTPHANGLVLLRPLARIVSQAHFKGEIDEDDQGEIFLTEALVEQLEVGDGIVGLEANLRNEVDEDESLDIFQLHDTSHSFVDPPHALILLGGVLFLQDGEAEGDEQIEPAEKGQVGVEGDEADIHGLGAEPFIRKIGRVEGEKDGIAEELASGQAYRLRRTGITQIAL